MSDYKYSFTKRLKKLFHYTKELSFFKEDPYLHTKRSYIISWFRYEWCRFRYKYIPYLVWYMDDIRVDLVFTGAPLQKEGGYSLKDVFNVQDKLRGLGLSSKGSGCGPDGRDIDYSSCESVRIKFRERLKKPESSRFGGPVKPISCNLPNFAHLHIVKK